MIRYFMEGDSVKNNIFHCDLRLNRAKGMGDFNENEMFYLFSWNGSLAIGLRPFFPETGKRTCGKQIPPSGGAPYGGGEHRQPPYPGG